MIETLSVVQAAKPCYNTKLDILPSSERYKSAYKNKMVLNHS